MATVLPQLTIDVQGESSLMLAPERAVLTVAVDVTKKSDKAGCTSDAVQAARSVEKILRTNSENGAIDYWSRTSLSETNYTPGATEWDKKPETKYTARVSFDLHVQKFNRLGGLIHELVAIKHVESHGVDWVLTTETKEAQRSNLRAKAAENARQKADQYAAALGYKDCWAFEAREASAYTRSSNRKGGPRMEKRDDVETSSKNMAAEEWEDVSEEAFQYSPEDVNMTQNIHVKFLAR